MNKVYIVVGSTGQYSDTMYWYVKAYAEESDAERHAKLAKSECDVICAGRDSYWDIPEGANKYDPRMSVDYTGVFYSVEEVEFADTFTEGKL